MKELLAKCGFRCDLCPAYYENIKSNEDKVKLSEGWQRVFGFNISPEEVECVGCHNEGKHADSGCLVRPCVIEKGLDNCACCKNFGCDSLKTRIDFLDNLLTKQDRKITDEDYQHYALAYESRPRLMKLRESMKTNGK
jgi:hypothetical protein